LLTATRNPLVILLIVLSMISFATGDAHAGTVMSLMVILGVSLRFVQEARADAAAAKLKAMITLTTAVVRAGKAEEIPLQELAPGDVVTLCAGDMIPADVRIISAKDLFVSQATLTGESLPVEKFDSRETREEVSPLEFANICFLGTSVESGAATAVVLATGAQTYFGSMASSIVGEQVETSFDKGMQQFTWLMIRFMMVMVPLVFFINGFTKHNWHEVFFSVGRRRADARNAADDRLVLVERRARDVENNIVKHPARSRTSRWMCSARTRLARHRIAILERHCDDAEGEHRRLLDAFIAHFQTD
jgi:Mg2+-importing ATPase